MKAVILAGGFGTRISEESHLRPKPMIEIGGKPKEYLEEAYSEKTKAVMIAHTLGNHFGKR